MSRDLRVVLSDDVPGLYGGRLLQRDDDVRYFRRWVDDIRSEFRRAMRRRQFFLYRDPEQEEPRA